MMTIRDHGRDRWNVYQEFPIFQGRKDENNYTIRGEKKRLPDILFPSIDGGAAMKRMQRTSTNK